MKCGVFSIYDSAAGVFTAPTIDVTDVSAKRSFSQAVNNAGSVMGFKPSDFSLYRVGYFDVENGSIEPCVPPVQIVSADRCMKVVIDDEV
uniref:Nonstructural protein n=1 Tax=Dulem virus 148 TaxID=3145625 RepID=A0AAU8BAF2_9VIRU